MRGERIQHKITFAKKLRRESSDAERILWRHLRNRQLQEWKFRRQRPIGPYVADFYCANAGLVIEVDGGQHAEQETADSARTEYFSDLGIKVLRFWNNEVLLRTETVLECIAAELARNPSPQPSPLGGEGVKERKLTGKWHPSC